MVFFDLKKAFDTVDHEIHKFNLYGIKGIAFKLVQILSIKQKTILPGKRSRL